MPFAFNLNDVDDGDKKDRLDNIDIGDRKPVTQKTTERGKKRKKVTKSSADEVSKKRKQNVSCKTKEDSSQKVDKSALIVSIDFGTTYSGASYRSNLDASGNRPHTIMSWPQAEDKGLNLPKMPTRIAYKDENKAWGPNKQKLSRDVIGYEVQPGMISYTWFKLLLDKNTKLTEFDDPDLESAIGKGTLQLPKGKTAPAVASDFLRIFRCVLMKELAYIWTREILDETPIEFVVTVPAIWDDKAQRLTHDALRGAGFHERQKDKILFISEPEAAALAVLNQYNEQSVSFLKKGTRALIVDLGGGTVDLECVRVENVSPLRVKLIGVGTGGKCGSTTIDRRFIAYMADTFGKSFLAIPSTRRGPGSKFMNVFEDKKKSFRGDLDEEYRIEFTALAKQLSRSGESFDSDYFDGEDNEVIITGQNMADFFQDTIDQICGLITRQVSNIVQKEGTAPDVVILAGGLSCSNYVLRHIRDLCRNGLDEAIGVTRPENAWSAISVGAVAFGLDQTLTVSRQARRHYFIAAQRAFREGVDPENRAVECPIHGKRVKGELQPLLKKGETISGNSARYLPGYIAIDSIHRDDLRYSYDIICSNADKPPVWEGSPGTYVLGQLDIDLDPVVGRLAQEGWSSHKRNFAKKPAKVEVNIVVRGGHAAGMLCVAANSNRMKLGEWQMDYTAQ